MTLRNNIGMLMLAFSLAASAPSVAQGISDSAAHADISRDTTASRMKADTGAALSLQDALAVAIRNSQNLEIGRNNVKIAHINNDYGIAGGLPYVNAQAQDNYQVTSINQEYSNPANNKTSNNNPSNQISGGITANMLLYNGARVQNAKRRLALIEDQTYQQLNSRTLLLVYNVMLKYLDILRQQTYAATLQQSIDVSAQKLRIVQTQQSVGMANNADLFQAQVDLNTQKQNLEAQWLVVTQDKADLLALLTLNPDSVVAVRDTILVDESLTLDSVTRSLASNPDIVQASQQIEINRHIEREVGAQRYPSLSLGTGLQYSHTENRTGFTLLNQSYGPAVGATLTVPIFNGGVYKRQERIAKINTTNAALLRDTLHLNYRSNAVKSWQAYQSNLKQLRTAQETYAISKKLLDLELLRFEYRQATIVDVKTAQQSFENAGYQLVNISYAAKVAELQLKRLANSLGR